MLARMGKCLKFLSGPLLVGLLTSAPPASAQVTQRTEPVAAIGKLQRPDAVRVSGKEAERFELLRGETPQQHYPERARKEAVDGIVVVDLLLNAQGQVLEAQVVGESPEKWGFGLAALDTAKSMEFTNPLKKLVLMSIRVEFVP
jgi:TonB family protein